MKLLTEQPTACAQPVTGQPLALTTLPVPTLSVQRCAVPWRSALAGLTGAAAGALRIALALAAAGVITACGPGTGGTGVGPVAGTYLSAGTPGTNTSAVPGATPSTISGIGYVLALEPQAVRLTGACLAFQFDGAWVEASGEIRVTGSYRQAAPASDLALATALPGTLVVRVESTGLAVTLLDARGAVVLSFTTGAKVADGAVVATIPACKSLPAGSVP